MHNIARENNQFNFILTNIDVFSRKAYAVPIKRKSADHVIEGFKKIHSFLGFPLKLHTDKGKEFLAGKVQEYLSSHGVLHYTTTSDQKAALCERFNSTLRRLMILYMSKNNTLKYVDVLDRLLKTYNSRYHSSLGMPPDNVNSSNEKDLWNHQYSQERNIKTRKFKFAIKDRVRIKYLKKIFDKGHINRWSKEIFTVIDTLHTNPPTYRLQDQSLEVVEGIFYERELQRVSIPQI